MLYLFQVYALTVAAVFLPFLLLYVTGGPFAAGAVSRPQPEERLSSPNGLFKGTLELAPSAKLA